MLTGFAPVQSLERFSYFKVVVKYIPELLLLFDQRAVFFDQIICNRIDYIFLTLPAQIIKSLTIFLAVDLREYFFEIHVYDSQRVKLCQDHNARNPFTF